jgi:hypothetical protein
LNNEASSYNNVYLNRSLLPPFMGELDLRYEISKKDFLLQLVKAFLMKDMLILMFRDVITMDAKANVAF